MKVAVSRTSRLMRKRGPKCLACGNAQHFWIRTGEEESLLSMRDVPDGTAEVVSCGRCRSRNSIVVTYID
jgi:hypothetical protein